MGIGRSPSTRRRSRVAHRPVSPTGGSPPSARPRPPVFTPASTDVAVGQGPGATAIYLGHGLPEGVTPAPPGDAPREGRRGPRRPAAERRGGPMGQAPRRAHKSVRRGASPRPRRAARDHDEGPRAAATRRLSCDACALVGARAGMRLPARRRTRAPGARGPARQKVSGTTRLTFAGHHRPPGTSASRRPGGRRGNRARARATGSIQRTQIQKAGRRDTQPPRASRATPRPGRAPRAQGSEGRSTRARDASELPGRGTCAPTSSRQHALRAGTPSRELVTGPGTLTRESRRARPGRALLA